MEEKTGELFLFTVAPEQDGVRVDKCIANAYDRVSRSYISKIIADGGVTINSEVVKKSKTAVHEDDEVSFILPPAEAPEIKPENIPISILYEDQDVIVVNKPKGMVVHPAPGHYSGTLVNAILYHCSDLSGINGVLRPGIVHRIDRDTTGSLIICKNDNAHRSLAAQLKDHSITRRYRAIVNGRISEDGVVDAPIGRNPKDRKKMAVVQQGGKRAVTHYHVLEQFQNHTYVECVLETGRTHQIRVHMAKIGHPIVGDDVYSSGKSSWHTEGQTLHAMTLGFTQPTTGEYVEVNAPLPEYFEKILNGLRGKS